MAIEREILDPKLKKALDEIDAILNKHQIAGVITLGSSTHAAFRLTLPQWSGIQLTDKGVHLKFRAGDPEHAASSMHLWLSLRDLVTMHSVTLCDHTEFILGKLREHGMEIEHSLFGGEDKGTEQ